MSGDDMSDVSTPPLQGKLIPPFLKQFAVFWIVSSLLVVALAYGYWKDHKQTVLEHYRTEAQHHVEGQAQLVRRVYRLVASNMHMLSHHLDLVQAIDGNPREVEDVTHLFSSMMEVAGIYDRALLLNLAGRKVLQTRWRNGVAAVVQGGHGIPSGEMEKGLQLPPGQIRIVSLKVLRQPDRPGGVRVVMRFMTPVVDSRGHKKGLLALDVQEAGLLSRALAETSLAGEHLLMHDFFPYWFERQGGKLRVREEARGKTLPQQFPLVWQRILKQRTGQFMDRMGLFSFESVHPQSFLGRHGAMLSDWNIVSFVPESALSAAINEQTAEILMIAVTAILLLGFLAWSLSMARVVRLEKEESVRRVREQLLSEVRALSNRMIHVQEEERKSVSRALHDDIGQMLVAIRSHIATAIQHYDNRGGTRTYQEMQEVDCLTHVLMETVRRYMRNLRPGYLEELGLGVALVEMCSAWEVREKVSCNLSLAGDMESLPEEIALTVFRIAQEGLTNIARHARASKVEIVLDVRSDPIILQISDDGAGMDLSQPSDGLGLVGMRERVQALGGEVVMDSAPGKGFRVRIRLPLSFVASSHEVG